MACTSTTRAPASIPRIVAAALSPWTTGPWVPSRDRTTGTSSPGTLRYWAITRRHRSIVSIGNQTETIRGAGALAFVGVMGSHPSARRMATRAKQFQIPAGRAGGLRIVGMGL